MDDVPLGVESGRHLRHAAQDVLVADACGKHVDVPDPVEDGDDEGVRTDRGRHVVDGLLKPGGLDRRQDDVVGGVDNSSLDVATAGGYRTSSRGNRNTAMFLHTPSAVTRCRNARLA